MNTINTLALALTLGATAGAVQAQDALPGNSADPIANGPVTGGPFTDGPITDRPITDSTVSDDTLPGAPEPAMSTTAPMPGTTDLPDTTLEETFDDALEPEIPTDPADELEPETV